MLTTKRLKKLQIILIVKAAILIGIYYICIVNVDIIDSNNTDIVPTFATNKVSSTTISLSQCTNLEEELHEKLKKYLQVQNQNQPFEEISELLEEYGFRRSLIPQDHSAEYKYRIYRNTEKKEVYLLQWSEFKDSNSKELYKSLTDIKHYKDNPNATYEDYLSY